MVKKRPERNQNRSNNLFDRAKIEFFNYEEFLDLFAQCTKRVVSEKVSNVEPFPKIVQITVNDENSSYSASFLRKLRDYFDNTNSIDRLACKIVLTAGGKIVSENTRSKRNLAKRKMLLNRILSDAILKAEHQFKENDSKNKNSKKIYTATLKTAMIAYPPGRISEKRFLNIISKLKSPEKEVIESIYLKIDGYYCGQNRINKKNFKEIAGIFFNLKHLRYENK
jgi:hypothetical protein